jgi:hypothetical protein
MAVHLDQYRAEGAEVLLEQVCDVPDVLVAPQVARAPVPSPSGQQSFR